jgi:hypothetical protein
VPIRASSLESGVRVFLPLAITPLSVEGQRGDFDAPVTGSDWGGLRVWRVNASPMSAMRAQAPHRVLYFRRLLAPPQVVVSNVPSDAPAWIGNDAHRGES